MSGRFCGQFSAGDGEPAETGVAPIGVNIAGAATPGKRRSSSLIRKGLLKITFLVLWCQRREVFQTSSCRRCPASITLTGRILNELACRAVAGRISDCVPPRFVIREPRPENVLEDAASRRDQVRGDACRSNKGRVCVLCYCGSLGLNGFVRIITVRAPASSPWERSFSAARLI